MYVFVYVYMCVHIYTYTNVYMTCAPMPGVVVFQSLSTDIRLPLSMSAYHCFMSCYLFRSLYTLCSACRILAYRLMFLFYTRHEIKLILSYPILSIICQAVPNILASVYPAWVHLYFCACRHLLLGLSPSTQGSCYFCFLSAALNNNASMSVML